MKFVEEKIIKEGKIINNEILKVDSFLNHQIDSLFADQIGESFASSFPEANKVLTIETSGVAFATTTAIHLGHVPVVFAKKSKSKIVDLDNVYQTQIKSFTRNVVSDVTVDKKYLKPGDKILIVDDFLAEGNAGLGLIDLCKQAGAEVIGLAAVINKRHQGGEKAISDLGIRVYSGAVILDFVDGKPIFSE